MAEITASLAGAVVKILLALLGVILNFLLLPSTRKVSIVLSGVVFSAVGGYIVHEASEHYHFSNFYSSCIAVGLGFFGLAVLQQLTRLHVAIATDEKLVKATLDRLEKWIRG
jgi:hypothetical protein